MTLLVIKDGKAYADKMHTWGNIHEIRSKWVRTPLGQITGTGSSALLKLAHIMSYMDEQSMLRYKCDIVEDSAAAIWVDNYGAIRTLTFAESEAWCLYANAPGLAFAAGSGRDDFLSMYGKTGNFEEAWLYAASVSNNTVSNDCEQKPFFADCVVNRDIKALNLPLITERMLLEHDILTVDVLCTYSERELLSFPNMGRKRLRDLIDALELNFKATLRVE